MSKFPQPFTSTVSHWQATVCASIEAQTELQNRGPSSLYNHGRDDPLPANVVNYLIIGAGMTGASLAYQLTRPGVGEGRSVAVLEAKDVASGATGRNGGHLAPYTPSAFPSYTSSLEEGGSGLSPEEGLEVIAHEMLNYRYVAALIKEEKWDVDLWEGLRCEVKISEEMGRKTKEAFDKYNVAKKESERFREDPVEYQYIEEGEEAKRLSRVPKAIGVTVGPTGSVHPHKLATALMKSALASGRCDLFSWAPVTSLKRDEEGTTWKVDCGTRGVVMAKEVIVCTNAHTSNLFPDSDIAEHLCPYLGSCVQVTPPTNYSGAKAFNRTGVMEGGCYHMTTPAGQLVVGVGNPVLMANGIIKRSDAYGNVDDSKVHPGVEKFLSDHAPTKFENWITEAPGEGTMRAWSGIMCASRDALPLVGKVPDEEGLWIAAGFHGHGMSRIPITTRSLAQYILTEQWDPTLPRSFEITKERLKRGKVKGGWLDEGGRDLVAETEGGVAKPPKTLSNGLPNGR